MSSSSADKTTENEIFESILKSMDVRAYDPNVITAIAEYARRFTSDLLCDAKDYSNHAGRSEVDASDIKLALELMDARANGNNNQIKVIQEIAEEINSQPLSLINNNNIPST